MGGRASAQANPVDSARLRLQADGKSDGCRGAEHELLTSSVRIHVRRPIHPQCFTEHHPQLRHGCRARWRHRFPCPPLPAHRMVSRIPAGSHEKTRTRVQARTHARACVQARTPTNTRRTLPRTPRPGRMADVHPAASDACMHRGPRWYIEALVFRECHASTRLDKSTL